MTPGDRTLGFADDAAKRFAYENRTWAELPLWQRRFYLWLVLTFVLVDPLARVLLQVLGLSESASSALGAVVSLLILTPFGLASWREAKERKAAGLVPPAPEITHRILTGWIVTAILLWILYGFLVSSQGFVLPVLPLVVSFFAALRWTQRRSQKERFAPEDPAVPARPDPD
ncbi:MULTISPECIES: hypothetical protein [unclassified Arthrobacter]|uniref:hypothetical protein n=1 Tax=unclassified Arthrobacter TaxID=235627 RepID=UPI000CE2E90D|nr:MULTISPECIES: hypothetical protein [unclassified Arthrobacter]